MGWWAHSRGQRMAITGKRSQEHRGTRGRRLSLAPITKRNWSGPGWGWKLAGTQFSPQLHVNCNPGMWRCKQENQKIKVIFV